MSSLFPKFRPWRTLFAAVGLVVARVVAAAPGGPEAAGAGGARSGDEAYVLPADPAELLRLDDEMRAFFTRRVPRRIGLDARLDAIVSAILGEDGLHFTYEAEGLYDVREAFRRRRGNCVTFALMVVAVAREHRIPAKFNEVEIRPRWSRTGRLVLESRHINVYVQGDAVTYEIDLQLFANLRASRRSVRVVDDRRAFAGLYSNAGVYRLAEGDRTGALRLLERAAAVDPTCASVWSNLGATYLLGGETERARGCYERALAERSDALAAISGLAWIHREAGRLGLAAKLERAAVKYRERNPYYLYTLAREEQAVGDVESAYGHLVRAIRIKGDEPEFYELAAQMARALGRPAVADRWERRLARIRRAAALPR